MATFDLSSPEMLDDLEVKIPEIRRIEKLVYALDSAFSIPGTNIRFGLDPVLGLIPGLGDTLSFAISGYMLFVLWYRNVRSGVIFQMFSNLVMDYVLGMIPVIGDVIDFGVRPNQQNWELLQEEHASGTLV